MPKNFYDVFFILLELLLMGTMDVWYKFNFESIGPEFKKRIILQMCCHLLLNCKLKKTAFSPRDSALLFQFAKFLSSSIQANWSAESLILIDIMLKIFGYFVTVWSP